MMIRPYFLFRINRILRKREKIIDLVRGLKESKSILILCENKSADVMSFFGELKTLLPKAKLNTWIFNQLNENLKTRSGGVKESVIKEVRVKEYDLVIDLTMYNQISWLYFVANIRTKITVGVLGNDENGLFDLIVSPNSSSAKADYQFLIDYITKLVNS